MVFFVNTNAVSEIVHVCTCMPHRLFTLRKLTVWLDVDVASIVVVFLTTILFCFAAGVEGKGVTATKEYTGCMRNLVSKNPGGSAQAVSLVNPLMMAGNVYLGGCPYYTS